MKTHTVLLALLTALILLATPPARAGFDEGLAAYKRGEYATALAEWRPLAEQGNANAQVILGAMYGTGRGVPQDDREAVAWFRKAAEQGDAVAQYSLGLMYEKGRGVAQDFIHAYMWLNVAGIQNEKARKARDTLANVMSSTQIAEAQRLSWEWKPKR